MKKKIKKAIVITSIFPPTKAIAKFANLRDWQLIVVGDKKTDINWHHKNVIYLSPIDQEKLGYNITKELPWNHYCRKMIGYLYAIEHGAEQIFDTDDDNIPLNTFKDRKLSGEFTVISGEPFINMYKQFTKKHIWPRGYPLDRILKKVNLKKNKSRVDIGIWQYLANGDTDVDAIFRLTINKEINFDNKKSLVLDINSVCPFNSQSTLFTKETFPLLFLPAFVTFRFTDILRGLISQPLLWSINQRLAFGPAVVVQERNPHNYLKDFESEVPVYLYSEKVVDIAKKNIKNDASIFENITGVYTALQIEGIVTKNEVSLLNLWLKDLKKLK